MKPFVAYCSRTGNTRKVAGEIAEALGTKAHDVRDGEKPPKGAFLVLGSGVYAKKAGREMMDFVQSLPEVKAGRAATFETSGDGKNVVAGSEIGGILEKRGYRLSGSFVCPGRVFFFWRRGCPGASDISAARKFAESLKKL